MHRSCAHAELFWIVCTASWSLVNMAAFHGALEGAPRKGNMVCTALQGHPVLLRLGEGSHTVLCDVNDVPAAPTWRQAPRRPSL